MDKVPSLLHRSHTKTKRKKGMKKKKNKKGRTSYFSKDFETELPRVVKTFYVPIKRNKEDRSFKDPEVFER